MPVNFKISVLILLMIRLRNVDFVFFIIKYQQKDGVTPEAVLEQVPNKYKKINILISKKIC